jgi:hypothetical protein
VEKKHVSKLDVKVIKRTIMEEQYFKEVSRQQLN